jgi:hypothetical protein
VRWIKMQVIIDIDEEIYKASQIIDAKYEDVIQIPLEVIKNSTPLLKGATNKDMFKTVFGYEPATDAVVCNKEDWCGASKPCNYCISNPNNIGREEDWWNAPYKAESEAEE